MDLDELSAAVEAARKDGPDCCARLATQKWIRVMCDFSASGVWDLSGRAASPEFLPIGLTLIARILVWQDLYENIYDDLSQPKRHLFADWATEGFQIAIEMKRQLPDWTVIYHDERRSVPSLPDPDWSELCDRLRPWFEYEITDAVMRTGLPPDNYPSDLPVLPE